MGFSTRSFQTFSTFSMIVTTRPVKNLRLISSPI